MLCGIPHPSRRDPELAPAQMLAANRFGEASGPIIMEGGKNKSNVLFKDNICNEGAWRSTSRWP